jgi:hypothetical protein
LPRTPMLGGMLRQHLHAIPCCLLPAQMSWYML